MSKILVVGCGYVGLTTAVGLAELGHRVMGYDLDTNLISRLSSGVPTIYEPGLPELLVKNTQSGVLSFTSSVTNEGPDFDLVFLCLPTPSREDGTANLTYLTSAVSQVRILLTEHTTVVIKSTVPVGTAKLIKSLVPEGVTIASNPEFLREGSSVYDFFHPNRIVIGAQGRVAPKSLLTAYENFSVPIVVTSHETAELIKYSANAFLAIKISFANELAFLSERTNSDIDDLIYAVGLDTRIGINHLNPGPGWGGSCFPKDTRELLATAQKLGVPMQTLQAAVSSNERTMEALAGRILSLVDSIETTPVVAILGLAFKAGTDDVRESPSTKVAELLSGAGLSIKGYDPLVVKSGSFAGVLCSSIDECLAGSHIAVLMTDAEEFRVIDPTDVLRLMVTPQVLDTRRILGAASWASSGITHHSLGFQEV